MLERTRIVLVNTSHPGNIGSVARAMKTMGLDELYLVSPQFFPHDKAHEMASGASDILERARVVQFLDDAIADCTLVLGTSARMRRIPWPLDTPREAAEKIINEPLSQTAILFGREQSGLTNAELQRCHFHIHIPANPDYSSLNIAQAVQIIAYELRVASLAAPPMEDLNQQMPTVSEMEKFFVHLKEVLIDIDFLKVNAPRQLMTRLRRLFTRTRPDAMETNMLRGMLTAIQTALAKSRMGTR